MLLRRAKAIVAAGSILLALGLASMFGMVVFGVAAIFAGLLLVALGLGLSRRERRIGYR